MKMTLIVIATACGSWLVTGLARRYALAQRLIDNPNKRSSHNVPTPRGGGASIVLTVLIGLALLTFVDFLAVRTMSGFVGAGLLVAAIGLVDDHRHIAASWRLMAHAAASVWLLFWLVPTIGWMEYTFAATCLVWLINLYNFMDGIDGIASVEAITVCTGGAVFCAIIEPDGVMWAVPLLILAAVTGFLPWNVPPAKIFMGDAGSGFIGIMLGAFAIQALTVSHDLFWAWTLLLGCFVVDATVTLLRRVLRGEKFYEAHRDHAYQSASRKFKAHKPVTISIGLVNLLWLFPIGLLVVFEVVTGVVGLIVGWTPLVAVVVYFAAGEGSQGNRLHD